MLPSHPLTSAFLVLDRVLVPKDDPKTLTQMLSFCDTYNRPIYIKNEQYPNGAELQCTCIVSVVSIAQSVRA